MRVPQGSQDGAAIRKLAAGRNHPKRCGTVRTGYAQDGDRSSPGARRQREDRVLIVCKQGRPL